MKSVRHEIDIFPANWRFPADGAWVAGWIATTEGQPITDVRARLDRRVVLGLHGMPRPSIERRLFGHAGPPFAGFSFLLRPTRDTHNLVLEARNERGRWSEFFRHDITVDPGAPAVAPSIAIEERLGAWSISALAEYARDRRPLEAIASEVVSAGIAEPLNALPPPPFFGALEGPTDVGWMRYGRLNVHGWIAHRVHRITRLTAMVDATTETVLLHGLPRTGVDAVFADLPGADRAQFVGRVDLPPDHPTPVLLKIFAELDNGERRLAFAQRFTPRVIAGNDRPLPPRSRLLFARCAWRVIRAARDLHLPLGSARVWLPALRDAWARFSADAPATERDVFARTDAPASPPTPLRTVVATHNLKFEGAPWFIFELARYLRNEPGAEVSIVSPEDGPMANVFRDAGLSVEVLDLSTALGARTEREFHAALAAIRTKCDWSAADIVIANTMLAFWAVHLAESFDKPSLLYVHESSPVRRFFVPLVAPGLFRTIETAFRRATRVVFTASATLRVHRHLGRRRNFSLLPSWIDVPRIDAFAAAHSPAELRRKHGLDPSATWLVNIGSLCERKGQHIFIRAIELLRDELRASDRPIRFALVGARPGPYLETLKEECRLHGLEDLVVFVPETREIYDFYRLADIFVCTSFEESFPRVLLESAAFRLPIVSTNVDGIAEMLEPTDAWFTTAGNRDELARAMRDALAAHFAGDRTRAERARTTVERKYHQALALPRHLALAQRAVEERK